MASVTRKGAKWLARWDATGANGERRQIARLIPDAGIDRREAQRRASVMEAEARGTVVAAGKEGTVGAFLDRWLAYQQRRVAPATFERDQNSVDTIGRHPGFTGIKLHRLEPEQIEELDSWLATCGRKRGDGGLAPRSVRQTRGTLRKALRLAVRWRLLARDPMALVEPPPPPPRLLRAADHDDLPRLLAAIQNPILAALVTAAALTGCRRGELLGLTWADVDLDAGRLVIARALSVTRSPTLGEKPRLHILPPKSQASRRTIALDPTAIDLLGRHKRWIRARQLESGRTWNSGDLVFPSPEGELWSPSRVSGSISHAVAKAGISRGNLHSWRHGLATAALKAGVHPKIVQNRLGHSSVALTLDTYSEFVVGMDEGLARIIGDRVRGPKHEP